MTETPIVVIGASTGGFEALQAVLGPLPRDFGAAIFVVIHIPRDGSGMLASVIRRWTSMPVAAALHGEPIRAGRVYVAPPDRHMLLRRGQVVLSRGPRENRFRPAVDPLFRTAAAAYGAQVIGVVLSGGQDDGVAGLHAVKQHGGVALVQDPGDALAQSMPLNAIREVAVDEVLPARAIGRRLVELVSARGAQKVTDRPALGEEAMRQDEPRPDVAEVGSNRLRDETDPPSPFTCPECGGALWEVKEGDIVRFRCHVGHGYSDDSLVESQGERVEEALWYALRALEENAALFRRMAARAHGRKLGIIAGTYQERAFETEQRAAVIRDVLVGGNGGGAEERANQAREDRTERDEVAPGD